MSNGEPNPIQVIYRDVFGTGKSSALTSKNNEVILKLVKMHILEMEDVLFHLNSAVMMPENPQGESSNQGGGAEEEQIKVSGIKALALVFKQFEFDPEVKMVVSGHTDTSGTAEFNFKLSKERALNILYLIYKEEEEDSRKKWAEVCYNRQKVEDYQQILTYFEKKLSCGCDPQGIDDTWGDDTKKATENFLIKMGLGNVKVKTAIYEIESDQKKRWPVSIWELVYDLYSKELCEVLEISDAELESRRKTSVKFVDDEKKIVACGESFPIDQKEKSNYRSQKNRRVELLFFDKDESPDLTCPADIKNTHKEEDCPLWRKFYFVPLYIDPDDLKAVAYHLQFVYYDKIKQKQLPVPAGLSIKAYEDGHNEIPSETVFKEGVYFVKVKFKNKIKDPARTQFYFELETTNKWVFTKDDKTDPEIVTKTPDEIKKLNFIERHNYYDLPVNWSSRNYWTRYRDDINKGERFEKVFFDTTFTDSLKLKPFGDEITIKDKPLVFSFDDIVLFDRVKNTQELKDWDHNLIPNEKDLSEKSRVKIFLIDKTTGMLKLYQKTNVKKSARIPFLKEKRNANDVWVNLILEDINIMKDARIIFFRNSFYTIGDKRTVQEIQGEDKNFVLGARAAVLDDPEFHVHIQMMYNGTEFGSTGDYDLHYFHFLHLEGDHPVSYTISYVSISFMKDCRDPANFSPIPTAADVTKYVDEGVYNAMDHWNRKRYFLEEDPAGDDNVIIRPFYFFDERETFSIAEPVGGFKIDFDKRPPSVSNHTQLFSHTNMSTAQNKAIGGRSKFLGIVCKDDHGHWGPAYHWAIRSEGAQHYSLFKLNKSGYTDWSDVFTGVPVTEHGDSFGANTFAHELGHATGQPDEYVKQDYQPNPARNNTLPAYAQYYIPYSMATNLTSMMHSNAAPRLHHLWYPMHRLNQLINDPNSSLSKLLTNKKFVARLNRDTWNIKFNRNITDSGNPRVKNNSNEALYSENLFQVNANPLKRLKIELYDTAKDESSIKYFHLNQAPTQYQAVLVVRVLLSVKFTGTWTGQQKALRLFQIEQAWINLGGHYRLTNGTKDFKNIYIHFLPGFSSTWAETGSCYNTEFHRTNAPSTGARIPNVSGTIQVHQDVDANELTRYFINASGGSIQISNFNFLKIWVDSKITENFTLQHF